MSSISRSWKLRVRLRIAKSALFGFSILATSSCSSTDATSAEDLPACSGPVAISVSTGTTPTFSWSPACKVFYLDIGVVDTDQEIWAVANFDAKNTISPGVKFGVTPAGTRLIEGPVSLQPGTKYSVFIAFYNNGIETDGGRVTFTP